MTIKAELDVSGMGPGIEIREQIVFWFTIHNSWFWGIDTALQRPLLLQRMTIVCFPSGMFWRQLYKNRSSRKTDSTSKRRVFREIIFSWKYYLRIDFPGRPILYNSSLYEPVDDAVPLRARRRRPRPERPQVVVVLDDLGGRRIRVFQWIRRLLWTLWVLGGNSTIWLTTTRRSLCSDEICFDTHTE